MSATSAADPAVRTYRFAPLDRGGWVLGLGGIQCAGLAFGVLVAGAMLRAGRPAPLVLGPLAAAAVFAFGAWEGRTAHEWAPVVARHFALRLLGRHRWFGPVQLVGVREERALGRAALPPFLAGIEVLDAGPAPWCPATTVSGIGVVRDRRDHTVSASVAVRGRRFSLVERSEQERVVERWGDALSAFCTERRGVSRVRVTERCWPAGVGDHLHFADSHATSKVSAARRSYDELLADAGPLAVRHEALLTVTVDERGRRSSGGDGPVALLVEELRLLTSRLESAGLEVDAPLSAARTADAFRVRLDASAAPAVAARARSLAALAGAAVPAAIGPTATASEWSYLRADGSCHRTYWVAEWPRLEVGPNWLEPVLLHAGGVRTFSLHFEPVPPSRSQRRIDRDATRLAADEEQRVRAGFRVGARHQRAKVAVQEREAELVAGFAELEYAGFLTVSAADPEALARSCAEHEQVAAQAGLDLCALDGRHDLGVVCALPVGRGLARRRFA